MASRVAVLVLNYNGRQHLEPCFRALQAQTYRDFDAFLVDNASRDDSCQLVARRFPWVRVLLMPENLGLPAYNRVIAALDHELVALLNNDTAVQPTWLAELVRALDDDPSAAAATSKILFMDDPSTINHAGGAITWLGLGYDIGFGQPDGPPFDCPRYVGAFCGGAALLRRRVFLDLGGFDDTYFAYFEDVDLSWRMALHSYRVLYVPSAVVHHKFGASFGPRGSLLRERLCERNRWATMIKNVGAHRLGPLLLASCAFHLLKLLEHLLLGRPAHARALLLGLHDAARALPHTLRQRRRIQRSRTITDHQLARDRTIVPLPDAVRERLRLGWAAYRTPSPLPPRRA